MAILESAKPGVLQLLAAPERREWSHLVVQFIFTARHGGREIKQGAASLEHTSANIADFALGIGSFTPALPL